MASAPRINGETVAALLDTAWRLADADAGRTDSLDRKAAGVATFASVLTSLAATLGVRSLEDPPGLGMLLVFWLSLLGLVGSVTLAVAALLPSEYVALGMGYLRRFPTWPQIVKTPEEVRGDTMQGVIEGIAREREANDRKATLVKVSLLLLVLGLVLLTGQAATLASGGAS